ncbi:hypothetical protein S101395_01745 [Bacillus sonorensis]|uniref:Uncharacterized protein n=1 Tax=Bacillus sonorensis TaxID=119858 RepID=A0ABM6LG47_9BACI|nr:hypothetical protein S101395_01745 [Bacillus sonorensis]
MCKKIFLVEQSRVELSRVSQSSNRKGTDRSRNTSGGTFGSFVFLLYSSTSL